jgi:hypothetical protein
MAFVRYASPLVVVLAAVLGCDEPKPVTTDPAAVTTAAPKASASAAPSAAATVTGRPKIKAPRPVPLGSSGPIQPNAPESDQMMAIQYTLAMVAVQNGDPPIVDKDYLDRIKKKLAEAVRTADKGTTPPNPIKLDRGNRKIEVQMGKGCLDSTPANLIHQRAGSSLEEAYQAGVLVISCHDSKWECHQSTRIPEDVLCHYAPRH